MNTRSPEGQPTWPYQPPAPTAHAAPAPKGRKVLKRVGMAGAFLVTFLFGYSVGDQPDAASTSSYSAPAASAPAYDSLPTYEAPAPAVEQAPVLPSGPLTTFSDGTYEVGVDVEPGRYKTPGSGGSGIFESCYWERASNDSGEFSAIKANDNITGPGSITVKSGEFVKTNGGCVWTKQ